MNFPPLTRAVLSLLLAQPHLRQGLLVVAGVCLTLIQGRAALQAAELPQVLTGVNARFVGAQLPVVNGNSMVINQFADKATLNWQSFNISADGSVEFKQPTSSSVALNRIFDLNPSQINGKLTANGQVYLINQNGILFGTGAQVNTQSLVASTLDIDDRVYAEIGFVNAINDAGGALPAFDSFGRPMGEIRIAEGATLESGKAGRILIFAPTIVNEGTIKTPEGQQVLAAAQDRVLIAASDDPNLRGLLVEVSTGGDVTNLGSLIAERGNISMLGMAVNQDGLVRATTSVSLNGSIRLAAQDMDGTLSVVSERLPRRPQAVRGGELQIGSGSVTEVVPDTTRDKDGAEIRAADAQTQSLSRVALAGTQVRLASGSRVTSTGGLINLTAAVDPGAPPDFRQPGDPATVAAQLVVESGAILDASGDDSTVTSVARNVVNVEARGNELADSPVQRDGPIRNETLQVDVRTGTDFLNIDGAVASIQRSAAERQSVGGAITIQSEGAFTLEEGALVDVSGGKVTYSEGIVSTSRLRQANGKVVDISGADPDQTYTGLVSNTVRREAGYVEGKDAGSLTIQARGLDLDGTIAAGSVAGAYQRGPAADLSTSSLPAFARRHDEAPLGGALALTFVQSGLPELIVGRAPAGAPAGVPPLVLSGQTLVASGASRIGIVNAGPVSINDDLLLPAWSTLSLTGTQVGVSGDLRIPGGRVTLNSSNSLVGNLVTDQQLLTRIDGTIDLSGTWVNDNPLLNATRPTAPIVLDGGRLAVNSGSAIEVSDASRLDVSAGAWRAADGTFIGGEGGRIAFATGAVDDDPFFGSRLLLGGELRGFGFSGGGELSIATERIQVVAGDDLSDDDVLLDASSQFGLREVGDAQGNLQYVLEVGAGTFQQGGFRSYQLSSSRADLEVAAGTRVQLRTASLLLDGPTPSLAPTGSLLTGLASPVFAPAFARAPAQLLFAVNNDLANPIGPVADLRIADGASISADAGSEITLRAETSIFVDGVIDAPAGQIKLLVGDGPGVFRPEQMIWLGAGSALRANGTALIDTANAARLRRGEVLDAGRITVRAEQGSIIGAAGASISVDGARDVLDLGAGIPVPTAVASAAGTVELTAAESLLYQGSLSGAAPAGSQAAAGRLIVGLDASNRGIEPLIGVDGIPRGPHTLRVQDFAGTLPGAGAAVDSQYASTGFVPLAALQAGGFSSLDLFARSSAVGLNQQTGAPVPDTPESLPIIEFPTDLTLRLDRSITLDAAVLKTEASQVSLAAPYVGLGYTDFRVRIDGAIPDTTGTTNPQPSNTPIRLTPTAGTGLLSVAADLVELIGESVTQGFGDTAAGLDGVVIQSAGDLRLRGVRKYLEQDYAGLFRTAGNLRIDAQRIYPSTLTSFEVAVEGDNGQLVLGGAGGAAAPLSVGGELTLNAENIVQGGQLFAPLGELKLNAASTLRFTAGSLTSTSGAGVVAPFFRTEPGGALILPAPSFGEDQIVFVESDPNPQFGRELPQKRINLEAPVVELQPGSRFDLRGGSSVAATEFVPGPGGSRDILLADLASGSAIEPNSSFAILPGVGGFAPYDPLETPDAESVQGLRIGDTVIIEDGLAGLPAGEYAVLPARYALFGGFLVTPEAGTSDLRAGQGLRRLDGATIVAGRFGVAGNDTADSRSQGFAIETAEQVRKRAEYLITPLDDLYTDGTARAPRDAGNLVIEAADRLQLQAELIRDGVAAGLGSAVDIATSAALSVVNFLTGADGIELLAADLEKLGADSLLLGGTRTALSDGLQLNAASSEIRVEAGVDLDLPELLLVGGRIVVEGSPAAATRLVSSAAATPAEARLLVEDDAAVLALSSRRLSLDRGTASLTGTSSLAVAGNASLEAGGGLVLDAAGDVSATGSIGVRDGVLSLGAAQVSIGQTDSQSIEGGLVFSNADLGAVAGGDLRLRSRGLIDIYGDLADPTSGAPLDFGTLTLDAQGIRGLANGDTTTVLAAETIRLGNSSGGTAADAGAAAQSGSTIRLQATKALELGDGSLAIQGYDATLMNAGTSLVFTGDSGLKVDGELSIDAPVITAGQATTSSLLATGRLAVSGGDPAASVPTAAGLGARLTMSAADIDFGGRIVLPSGTVRLVQTGDPATPVQGNNLRVAGNAAIDVAGDTLVFGPKQVGTPGGTVSLEAETGTLELAAGAVLDVSGATDAEAGTLELRAAQGAVSFAPGLRLLARDSAQSTGSLLLDAGSLASSDPTVGNAMTSLSAVLESGGFRASRKLRLRDQDILIETGSTIRAREIRLVSDTGSVTVDGSLDASGPAAGSIWLAAGDRLNISGTLLARASDERAEGGRVDLFALDADGDDGLAGTDVVNLLAGSLVDVTGGTGGSGGDVFVHSRRLDTNADGQTDRVLLGEVAGDVTGANRAQLVATRVLRDPNASLVTGITRVNVTGSQIEAWRAETETFLSGLAAPTAGPLQVTAGLQVESSGDLVLLDPWNFINGWYFGRDLSDPTDPQVGLTGALTLRAARHLELRADLTDSFAEQYLFGFLPYDAVAAAVDRVDESGAVVDQLIPQSWGYRLAGGSDLASADVLAFGEQPGELRLASDVRVRTGTADIDLAASGDIRLQSGAAVYTAGRDRGLSAQLVEAMAPVLEGSGLTAYDFIGTFLNGGQFPDDGGSVTITGGGSLVGTSAPGPITEWLTRIGSGEITGGLYARGEGYGAVPTHWGAVYGQFRNGVGAFGGGDVRIAVAGDLRNMVLATPTTGRSVDGVVVDNSDGLLTFLPSQRTTEILGGGSLDVSAGGAVTGGQVVIGGGRAVLRTGGDSGAAGAPQLYVGSDASIAWRAGRSLKLGGLQDPTIAPLSDSQLAMLSQISNISTTAGIDNRFFTYTDEARVSLRSLGGDVTLDGPGFGGFLPPSLAAVAFGGDVNIVATPLEFFPSPVGQLELLARDNVVGNFIGSTETRLRQSDQDRASLPSVDRPDIVSGEAIPARVPVHTGDATPNLIVARDGSIQSSPGKAGFWTLELAKTSIFQAGTDISNLAVRVQNIASNALTSFKAGRDIVQGELRDNTGRFDSNDRRIFEIWGPGSAEFVAGRNISLGTSAGIESIGNARNSALAAEGSSLRLLAGTGGEPAWDRFIEVYLSGDASSYRDAINEFLMLVDDGRDGFPTSNDPVRELPIEAASYSEELVEFLDEQGIPVINGDPLGTFRSLDRSQQRILLTDILISELKDWGTVSETADRADRLNYVRGYAALDTLFALDNPLVDRAATFAPGEVEQLVQDYLTQTDPQVANAAQVALFGTFFPERDPQGDISLLLSQVQTLAGGSLTMLAPGGDINAGAADAGIIDKAPADLGIVTARGGDINIAVDKDLLVNSTRVFALQGDLLIWSSNGNIDAGKGAKTVTSIPDPITSIDPNTGNTIIEFPPAVAGSGLQGENAALFAPRGAVNAGDAGIRTSGDLTIGAIEIVGTDNIDVGGVEVGFSTSDVVAVAPPGAASAAAASQGMTDQAGMLSDANDSGERTIQGTEVSFISVEVLSFGEACDPEKDKNCD